MLNKHIIYNISKENFNYNKLSSKKNYNNDYYKDPIYFFYNIQPANYFCPKIDTTMIQINKECSIKKIKKNFSKLLTSNSNFYSSTPYFLPINNNPNKRNHHRSLSHYHNQNITSKGSALLIAEPIYLYNLNESKCK